MIHCKRFTIILRGFILCVAAIFLSETSYSESIAPKMTPNGEKREFSQNRKKPHKRPGRKRNRRKHDNADDKQFKSKEARQDKQTIVLAEIAMVDIFHAGFGAEVGTYLTPDRLMELSVLQAKFEFLGFSSEYTFLTGEYHMFFGNSFYAFAGGGIRMIEASQSDFIFATDYESTFKSTHLVGGGGIGNRWQWSNFTMGCDWVAYMQPIFKISSSSSATDEGGTRFGEDESNYDSRVNSGNTITTRFHLGVSF